VCGLVILSKYHSTKSKTFLAESFGQHLLVIFTALEPFYVTLHGCNLIENTGVYSPEHHIIKAHSCINTQQKAAKIIFKVQQPLAKTHNLHLN